MTAFLRLSRNQHVTSNLSRHQVVLRLARLLQRRVIDSFQWTNLGRI